MKKIDITCFEYEQPRVISVITNEKPERKAGKYSKENRIRNIQVYYEKAQAAVGGSQIIQPSCKPTASNRTAHTIKLVALVSNVMGTSQHRLALLLIAVKIVPKERERGEKKEGRCPWDQAWIIKRTFRGSRPTAYSTSEHEKTLLRFDSLDRIISQRN